MIDGGHLQNVVLNRKGHGLFDRWVRSHRLFNLCWRDDFASSVQQACLCTLAHRIDAAWIASEDLLPTLSTALGNPLR